jgi:hypothetical protein
MVVDYIVHPHYTLIDMVIKNNFVLPTLIKMRSGLLFAEKGNIELLFPQSGEVLPEFEQVIISPFSTYHPKSISGCRSYRKSR